MNKKDLSFDMGYNWGIIATSFAFSFILTFIGIIISDMFMLLTATSGIFISLIFLYNYKILQQKKEVKK